MPDKVNTVILMLPIIGLGTGLPLLCSGNTPLGIMVLVITAVLCIPGGQVFCGKSFYIFKKRCPKCSTVLNKKQQAGLFDDIHQIYWCPNCGKPPVDDLYMESVQNTIRNLRGNDVQGNRSSDS